MDVSATCNGAETAKGQQACLDSVGTCIGATPDVIGAATKRECTYVCSPADFFDTTSDQHCDSITELQTAGTFTSTATYVSQQPSFSSTALYAVNGVGTCQSKLRVTPVALADPYAALWLYINPLALMDSARCRLLRADARQGLDRRRRGRGVQRLRGGPVRRGPHAEPDGRGAACKPGVPRPLPR